MMCCAAPPKESAKRQRDTPTKSPRGGNPAASPSAHDDFGKAGRPVQKARRGGSKKALSTGGGGDTFAPYGQRQGMEEDEDSDDEDVVYESADEEFELLPNSAAVGGAVDYGIPRPGQCAIGGKWVDHTPAVNALGGDPNMPDGFEVTKAIGWDQPDPREVEPLTQKEAADCQTLARKIGEEYYRKLPADLQLAFVRDVYGNYEGCGWAEEDAMGNTVELMRNCAKWREEIDADNLPYAPDFPGEDVFRSHATHSFSGADKWGHPRLWATVTSWPPIAQDIRDNFSAEEVHMMHTKRFLEFQELKRKISAKTQVSTQAIPSTA